MGSKSKLDKTGVFTSVSLAILGPTGDGIDKLVRPLISCNSPILIKKMLG